MSRHEARRLAEALSNGVNQRDASAPESAASKAAAARPGDADFGFRDVDAAEKSGLVKAVFDSVAGRYDLMNDLMSGGVHRLWKAAAMDWIAPRDGQVLLDVAGGTGDLSRLFLARIAEKGGTGPLNARAIVCDINESMIAAGQEKSLDQGELDSGLEWIVGDAEALPLPDASVDVYTIGFGLRNVTDKDKALAEAHRVLRPGGRFLCLEFSTVALPLLGEIYDRFSFSVVPWIGKVVTGDREAYAYLVESIRRFPDQTTLETMIRNAGFDLVKHRNLSGGIAAMHSAWRI